MKRISALLLAAVMLLCLVGCEEPAPATDPSGDPTNPDNGPKVENFTFTYNGTQIMLDADAAPVIAALGEPKSYTEETSCAFDGLDKTYFYGSFYLSTYPMDGKDYVYTIWLVDDSIANEDGVRIGNTQAQVEAVYGADCFAGTNSYTQDKGESRLTILLEDGYVSSIQYEVIIN